MKQKENEMGIERRKRSDICEKKLLLCLAEKLNSPTFSEKKIKFYAHLGIRDFGCTADKR